MKLENVDTASSGKRQALFYANDDEIKILRSLVSRSLEYTPETFANGVTINRLRSMQRAFKDYTDSQES